MTSAVALLPESLAGVGGEGKQLFISYLCPQSTPLQKLFAAVFYNMKSLISPMCLFCFYIITGSLGFGYFYLFIYLFLLLVSFYFLPS